MLVKHLGWCHGSRTLGFAVCLFAVFSGPAQSAERSVRGLYVMDADGGNLRPLDLPADRSYGSPAWSHDGQRIAFDSWPSAENYTVSRIYTCRLDGTELTDLAQGAMPSWSPDDKQIVCHVYGNPRGIVIMGASGAGRELLIPEVGCPRWSPHGTLIAHINWGDNISVLDTLTGEIRACLPNGWSPSIGLQWSPDGRRIAFRTDNGQNRDRLVVMTVAEDGPSQDLQIATAADHIGANVSWSPDGKRVLYFQRKEAEQWYQLYVVDAAGSQPAERLPGQLTGRHNIEPVMSPDGKQVLFVSEFID